MEEQIKEEPVTLKSLQKHVIKVLVAAIVITVMGGAGTAFAFFYKTNYGIEKIIINDIRQDKSIEGIGIVLNDVSNKVGSTNTSAAVLDEKIKGLEGVMASIQQTQTNIQTTQTDILKILGEIRRNK